MDSATVYVGIDVAKDQLVVAVRPTNECWETTNDARGHRALVRRLCAFHPTGIIVEATGGYEQPLRHALNDAGLPVSVVKPQCVRNFARSTPSLAKTDRIDAHVLAHYGETFRPRPTRVASPYERQMRDLVVRRRQLVQSVTAESNRLAHDLTPGARKSIERTLAYLKRELARIEHELHVLLQNAGIQERATILQSVPGVGRTSALTLITELPELGEAHPKQLSALVGVAPFARESGRWQGKRIPTGGRAGLRATLYMATMTATRRNPELKAFYDRLVARGKPKKVALIATMRKLITLLNALVRDQRIWAPSLRPAA